MYSSFSPLLVTEQLTIGYGIGHPAHTVASNLRLRVPKGQLVCLLGPNGSGKSTLLRTLAGMQTPLSGRVQLRGKSLENLGASQRARELAVVLTEPTYANLTTYELVAMGRYPYTSWLGRLSDNDRKAIEQALRVTGTLAFADRLVSTLSDGERQKVMIARAVAQHTPVMILDEPTAHLNVPNRTRVLRLLHQLAHQHQKAVVLSTHAIDLALLMADQLWLMHEGRIHSGVPEDLVLDGTLAATFAYEGMVFDLHTGTFRVTQRKGERIGLDGPMPELFWTRRALERVGYSVVSASADVLSVYVRAGRPVGWTVEYGGNTIEVDSVEELLRQLACQVRSV